MNTHTPVTLPKRNHPLTLVADAVVLIVLLLVSVSGFAQRTTGTLRGQVLDSQGAAVANAQVTITNQATGVSEAVVTTSAGTYQEPSILPGKYTVTSELSGI